MANSKREAESLINQWADRIANDDEFADIIYRTNLQTTMAGQLFVREVEVKPKTRSLTLDPPADGSFVNLPFDAAIDHFRSKPHVTPAEFTAMSDQERFRSFTARLIASERIRENARQLLDAAMSPDGPGLIDFQEALRADTVNLGISPSWHGYLENVYRTNTAVSYNAGRYTAQTAPDVVAGTGFWQYLTVDDDRVRDEHAALHEKTWRIGDATAEKVYPPNGYQCFAPDTSIGGDILIASRGLYSGELVKLTTKSGRVLAVTPNHPVATARGFVAAHRIREGDKVLADVGVVERDAVRAVNVERRPATAKECFGAVFERNRATVTLRPRSNDLHGDGRGVDGDVDIVAIDGELLCHIESEFSAQTGDQILAAAAPGFSGLMSTGNAPHGIGGLDGPTRSRPRSLALSHDLLSGFQGPLQPLRVGPSAPIDAALNKPAGDDAAADTEFVSNLLLRFSGRVSLDDVIDIQRYPYVGHVYDFQSVNGWVSAGGIIAGNCRCAIVVLDPEDVEQHHLERPVTERDVDAAVTSGFRGNPAAAAAEEASA